MWERWRSEDGFVAYFVAVSFMSGEIKARPPLSLSFHLRTVRWNGVRFDQERKM